MSKIPKRISKSNQVSIRPPNTRQRTMSEASGTGPVSKRPKLRTVANSSNTYALASKTTLNREKLQDFCGSLLADNELRKALDKKVRSRKLPPNESAQGEVEVSLQPVPLKFESAAQYASIFQNLMVEEAKSEIIANIGNCRRIGLELVSRSSEEREEELSGGNGRGPTIHCRLRANVRLPERGRQDWRESEAKQVEKHVSDGNMSPCGLSKLQRGDILIILEDVMARRPGSIFETNSRLISMGVVSRTARPAPPSGRDTGGVDIDVAVDADTAARLRNSSKVVIYVVVDCNVVTTWREWDGLNALLAEKGLMGTRWSSSLIPFLLSGGTSADSSSRSSSPTNFAFPDLKNVVTVDPNLPLSLPGATAWFQSELMKRYNSSQMDAIVAACTAKTGFVLVQGPPGTGKTHTLLALLNSLHLSVSQQCYEMDLPDPNKPDNVVNETPKFDWLRDKANPHLLIVAPSNAAIDNVLRLVITKGFLDGVGNRYVPRCIRIGSSNWNSSRGSDDLFAQTSLDMQVDDLMRLRQNYADPRQAGETDSMVNRLRGLEAEIRRLGKLLVEAANTHAMSKEPEKLATFHQMAGEWVGYRNRARDLALEIERRRLLFSQSGASDGTLRADMRALVLTQANLVFATLSQCGSPAMTEIAPSRVKFQVCVVDEAAQAVETSTLIPFSLGVEKCVMVGDPNQLPATVLSDRAARARYQQSLFERLQRCGHAVHLLDTQYRCRPELSSFCSATFYGGKLKDGANVLSPDYALPMYRRLCFGPLVFFDVSFGSQARNAANASLFNEAEADVCLALYLALRDSAMSQDTFSPLSKLPCHIAIISPYREQLSLINARFQPHLAHDKLLELNTVDGFQGREVDVVIFSCVRAYSSSTSGNDAEPEETGIGFLNDARRLNVAETRARFSLLIVGNKEVLKRGSKMWRGLLEHVSKRGRIVPIQQPGFDFLNA